MSMEASQIEGQREIMKSNNLISEKGDNFKRCNMLFDYYKENKERSRRSV